MNSPDLTYQLNDLSGSIGYFASELVLVGVFVVMILLELIWGKKNKRVVPMVGMLGLLGSLVVLTMGSVPDPSESFLFLGMIRIDGLSLFFRYLFGVVGILTLGVSMSSTSLKTESKGRGEYYIVVVAMVLGMNLMSMAANLLMMYLALELVSISSYVLTAYTRMNRSSAEASLKYIIYGAFSSAIMIYGISWFYGLTGSLMPTDVDWTLVDPVLILISISMILAGFFFKVSALPFHFWAPDVYEGAPYPVAAFFSVAPKAAGFALMIQFLGGTSMVKEVLGTDAIMHILAVVAMVTMTVGNLTALRQKRFRRMLAYSSIAHAGYLLMGVLVMNAYGSASVMFYLLVYACMNLAAFWIAGWMEEKWGIQEINQLKGTGRKNPALAVILTTLMIGLTGLPPTAGLTGKFYLFFSVWGKFQLNQEPILIILLGVALLNTVVSLFFYLRVPIQMIFGKTTEAEERPKMPILYVIFAGVLTIPVVILGVFGFDDVFNILLKIAEVSAIF